MNGSRLAFLGAALLALALVAGLARALQPDPLQRNFELFTEMAYSKAFESFAPNPCFADGRTLQPLVAGVVPRGTQPFPYGSGPEEALRAGRELPNQVPADDPQVATLGAELYRIACVVCHDARGNGKGSVTLRGMLPPPSYHAARALQMADGEMFHILTRGQGNMASYAAELSERERWLVIRHVRRLQAEGP